ncbi:MAG: glycoside hydrolase family 2 TIM barrel-domain containing protein [Bacteroidota bacterium]
MQSVRFTPVICLALGVLVAVSTAFTAGERGPRKTQSFDAGWRFHAGECSGAERPEYNDASWLKVNVPHDWSIEGLALLTTKVDDAPDISVVRGEWKFSKGDDLRWKDPEWNDVSWQTVNLPSTWEESSNYTEDNVFGWFRREVIIPADLKGKDIYINVGKIDDADETYFNGVKVGGMGQFPPHYVSAWDINRRYKVPHELIHYGGKNSIAVRVFDGIQGGGIYDDGVRVVDGMFESTCPGGSGAGYINAGTGWYRKEFTLPANVQGKRVFIEFDGVYMDSDVWLNGVHLGNRPYGYSSFEYELTPYLKSGGQTNVIAVRASVQQPCSRWYSGAGIYRHVRLTMTDPVHVAHWGTSVTTPEVSEREATVRVETKIRNQSSSTQKVDLDLVLVDDAGRKIANGTLSQKVVGESTGVFEQTLKLTNPRLWTLESPRLYRVQATVHVNDRVADACVTPFGVRTFEFSVDKGFFLNGKHVSLNGVCLHHDQGSLGSAVHKRSIERQLEIMKSMGCNAIRTSHNPPAPELLDLCDRMGFLVMDEAFDEWKRNKTMYGYGRFFDEWSERDLTDMILRDRNHPSIVMWSIGNEIPEQDNADAYDMAKRLADICRKDDPTRPVTSACNSPAEAEKSGFSKALDVFGVNYNMPFYQTLRGKAKLVASETASAVSTRGEYNLVEVNDSLTIKNQLKNQCSSYDDSTAESTLRMIKNSPWVAGQFVWTGFDYIGEPSPFPWPSVSSYFGIVDLCGFPKDRFYLYQSQWTDKPMVHLLPHWNWSGFEGKAISVRCYTNCESVELFLNGKSLGKKRIRDTRDLHLEWMVPYAPGTLKAIARNNANEVCTDEVQTTGTPAKILLVPDRREIGADGEDLSYVTVKIVDKEGRVCPDADNTIMIGVDGEGILAGVGNGNPISHEAFKAHKRNAFHGLCLAIVQSGRKPGTITLSAASEGLQAAQVVIHAK